MLIRFSVENWKSFQEEATFTAIATKERQKKERVPRVNKYKADILPVAAIYGANASGKSNLFKALQFVKDLVIEGTKTDSPIPVEQFRLDAKSEKSPTRFLFEILVDEIIYEFSFSINRKEVLEEKLVKITSSSEKTLYERKKNKMHKNNAPKKEKERLEFVFKGTRENQLFLTNAISQNVKLFRPVYDWFKYKLRLVSPNSIFTELEELLDEKNPLSKVMNEMLSGLDTGIARLGFEEIHWKQTGIPEQVEKIIRENFKEGGRGGLHGPGRFNITRENGELKAKRFYASHHSKDMGEIKFDIGDESDGTQRLIDLLPVFIGVAAQQSPSVLVIDEIDRSLHTLLTRRLLEAYLDGCSKESRGQLIFTTHDVLLMDQDLLRRDEMWVTERDPSGNSRLFSFSEYEVRSDKDIRKHYLMGRLGGIPRILAACSFADAAEQKAGE